MNSIAHALLRGAELAEAGERVAGIWPRVTEPRDAWDRIAKRWAEKRGADGAVVCFCGRVDLHIAGAWSTAEIVDRPPRYDDVFFDGVAWLDTL